MWSDAARGDGRRAELSTVAVRISRAARAASVGAAGRDMEFWSGFV
jgi:hypothetical protein